MGAGSPGLTSPARAEMEVHLTVEQVPAFNVVARIPAGAAEKLPGVIAIGAHYDHLGYGGTGSLEPDSKAVHPGADDNASGTAALIEISADLLMLPNEGKLKRDI